MGLCVCIRCITVLGMYIWVFDVYTVWVYVCIMCVRMHHVNMLVHARVCVYSTP